MEIEVDVAGVGGRGISNVQQGISNRRKGSRITGAGKIPVVMQNTGVIPISLEIGYSLLAVGYSSTSSPPPCSAPERAVQRAIGYNLALNGSCRNEELSSRVAMDLETAASSDFSTTG